jgi:hypothetical protein
MGILRRSVVLAALCSGGFLAQAFEQRTIWFNVPYTVATGTALTTTAPAFPPTFGPGQAADWASYDLTTAGNMGIPTGTSSGIRVPSLGQVFSSLSVPANLQGSLLSASMNVDFYLEVDFTFTYTFGAGNQNATSSATGEITVYGLQTPAPGFGGSPANAPILVGALTANGAATVSAGNPTATDTGTDTDTGTHNFTGGDLSILGSTTPSFAALPVDFFASAAADTSGNFDVAGQSFGGIRFSITYTFLPESNWAWAGLPLVFGAWAVRRRMTQATAA